MIYTKKEVSYEDIPQLSHRDKAYQRADEHLLPFIKYEVGLKAFEKVIAQRKKTSIDRNALVKCLSDQYKDIDASDLTLEHIKSLASDNTFTVITAHQPSLLTGPLYFIYKICSVISLSRAINEEYPQYKVIPLFVMGGEDHDFDEIATLRMFSKEITWSTNQKGPTGRMNKGGLQEVLNVIKDVAGTSVHAEQLKRMIDNAYHQSDTYGGFMIRFVNELFKNHGLVVANMDQPIFKSKLLPYVERDLDSLDSQTSVLADQEALESLGFKRQAHARKINIFYIDTDRYRVMASDDGDYTIGDTIYTKEELLQLLHSHLGNISPNVILRPVFQEINMPNLAYIGGGGELAYWMERKRLFDKWSIPFPMLIRRDSIQIVDKKTEKFIQSSGLDIMDFFQRTEQLLSHYTRLQSKVEIHLTQEKKDLEVLFDQIKSKVSKIDSTLAKTVLSEASKALKSLDYLQSKMLKAEKTKNEINNNKLVKTKDKLFPGNDGLQERHDNFIPYYLKYGDQWIDELVQQCDPLNKSYKILTEV